MMELGDEFCVYDSVSGKWHDGEGTFWRRGIADDEDECDDGDPVQDATRSFAMESGYRKAKNRYAQFLSQKNSAAERGIKWELTFRDWIDFWGDDIEWRGQGEGFLCMARVNDLGPYALWNVFKASEWRNRRLEAKYPELDLVLDG